MDGTKVILEICVIGLSIALVLLAHIGKQDRMNRPPVVSPTTSGILLPVVESKPTKIIVQCPVSQRQKVKIKTYKVELESALSQLGYVEALIDQMKVTVQSKDKEIDRLSDLIDELRMRAQDLRGHGRI